MNLNSLNHWFNKVSTEIIHLKNYLIKFILAPDSLLIITPSDKLDDNGEPTVEWQKFKNELERVKTLIDQIPKPELHRDLHPDTIKLGYQGQREFIRLGNDLLVS